ncbi:hypothetical protein BrE312_3694 [Brenneria sp. EniD312]|nr:hypothetical protein BrE312_3694 [Brenneria sp. EniD312]
MFVEGLARPLLREDMVCIPLLDSGMKWDISLIVGHESSAFSPRLLNFVSRFQQEIGGTCPLLI